MILSSASRPTRRRTKVPPTGRDEVHREAGYKCAIPTYRKGTEDRGYHFIGLRAQQFSGGGWFEWYNNDILAWGMKSMAKRLKDVQEIKEIKIERPKRAKLSPREVIKRMEEFPKRREKFIATIRKGKN
jgi:hypothetical protein